MIFYSHSEKTKEGKRKPTKELKKHLEGVTKNIKRNIHPHLHFSDFLIHSNLPEALGLFHDLGKYTTYFQEYLLNDNINNNRALKNHSLISAIFAFNFLQNFLHSKNQLCFILYYCIKHHHGSLVSPNRLPGASQQLSNESNLAKQTKNILQHSKTAIENLINDNFRNIRGFQLLDNAFEYKNERIRNAANRLQHRSASIDNYFIVLYLFSLLISADKIDAGEAKTFEPSSIVSDLVDKYLANKRNSSLVDIRNKARGNIENKLNEIDIIKDKLFTITAPTGIGKTLSVINFALKLKEKIQKTQYYNPQIIYCLPFINIIEQTYKVFNDLFKREDVSLLKHHQYSDIWAMAREEEFEEEEIELSKKLLEVEDWQADVILTTFVQLFHSIISNKNKMLKKFYRIAGSIIILDEIQNIKAEYWPLIGATFHHLAELLNCRTILMTATQPLIFETADKEIFKEQNKIKSKPLLNLKETEYFFSQFDRTKIISLIESENPLKDSDAFYSLFCSKWDNLKSCLIVVNTIKRSLDIFWKLKEKINSPHIYYLSTNLIPIHRKCMIRKIKQLLENKEKVILVSTQSVEAGVDLDFDMGFRDIGPLDSIIQVAGRINRNDREGFKNSPLYVVNFENDAQRVYGRIIINASLKIINSNKEYFLEREYLNLIQEYYNLITNEESTSFDESRKLYDAMQKLRFTKDQYEEETAVEDFKLIDDNKAHYSDVFIPITKNAATVLDNYINKYLKCEDMNKKKQIYIKIKSAFNQYKLSVPNRIINYLVNNSNGIEQLIESKLYMINKKYIGNHDDKKHNILYNYETGFCREEIKPETLIF